MASAEQQHASAEQQHASAEQQSDKYIEQWAKDMLECGHRTRMDIKNWIGSCRALTEEVKAGLCTFENPDLQYGPKSIDAEIGGLLTPTLKFTNSDTGRWNLHMSNTDLYTVYIRDRGTFVTSVPAELVMRICEGSCKA